MFVRASERVTPPPGIRGCGAGGCAVPMNMLKMFLVGYQTGHIHLDYQDIASDLKAHRARDARGVERAQAGGVMAGQHLGHCGCGRRARGGSAPASTPCQ